MMRSFLWVCILLTSTIAHGQFPTDGYSLENPTFLDVTVDDYNVFLMAEMHWDSGNSERKKRMIEYLASRNAIDVMVVERSYGFGHWVNHFFETGDSLLLKEYLEQDSFFASMNGVMYDDEYEFYRWLRAFNIENNLSIKVIGIDLAAFWHGKAILWSFLKFTEQNPQLHGPLTESIDEARKLMLKEKLSSRPIFSWYRRLEAATSQLKIDDPNFSNYLDNLQQSVKWSKGGSTNYREAEIAKNFMKHTEEAQKVYGVYVMGHISLTPEKLIRGKPFKALPARTFNSFASILNAEEAYRDKILSIGLVCFDCDRFNDYPGPHLFYPFLSYDDFDRLEGELRKLPHGTLVDLRDTDERGKDYSQLLLIEFNQSLSESPVSSAR